MNLSKRKNVIIAVLVFLLGMAIVGVTARQENIAQKQRKVVKAQLHLNSATASLKKDLQEAATATEVLEAVAHATNGSTAELYKTMKSTYEKTKNIYSLHIAPKGVVTSVYPPVKDKMGKIDFLHDQETKEVSVYSRNKNVTIIRGPFALQEGGQGIAIQNPVFLHNKFWGFTVALIKTNDLFNDSLSSLEDSGYYYNLYKSHVNESSFEKMASSHHKLYHPVVAYFRVGASSWKLEVEKADVHVISKEVMLIIILGTLLAIVISVMLYMILSYLKSQKELTRLVNVDYLTNVYNRHGFDSHSSELLKEHPEGVYTGLLIDVDTFKSVNDLYGHAIGDETLKHLAGMLKLYFGHHAIYGRNGGDEFSALIKNMNEEEVTVFLNKFIHRPFSFEYQGKEYKYSISIGYAIYPTQAKDLSELMRKADMALYSVKLRGKHGLSLYEEDMVYEGRSSLGFNLKDLSINLPGAFFIYQHDSGKLLFVNKALVDLLEYDSEADFMKAVHGNTKGLVVSEEYEQARNEVKAQLAHNKKNGMYSLDYHVETHKTHRKIKVHTLSHMVHNEYFGKISYVILEELPE